LLIDNSKATTEELLKVIPGPDFPTGGIVVEAPETIREAYETGRGGFRVRARWHTEDLGRGMWRIVVTEIPHLVQKSKLVEALAAVIENKKAPLLGDVRDESAEDLRLVLEPKARTVEAEILMESLFKLTALESRIPLNMNVLDATGAPRVMSLKEVLRAFIDHRRDVLLRRTAFRLEKIAQRLDVLAGLLIVFLNLDEVIRIIRNEDDPKAKLIQRFKLNETQAEAILNTRLRQLRKLEEMEIRREDAALRAEQAELQGLLEDTRKQWRKVGAELKETRKLFGPGTPFGKRRTELGEAAAVSGDVDIEAFVAREPVTVVLSEKGWIRALRGHVADMSEIKYKDGDGPEHIIQCQTTDKLLLFSSDGRAFTLDAHKLPGGRGHGEPVRLTVDMADIDQAVALFVYEEGSKRLVASQEGYGFVVPESEMLATKRSGKQVLNGRAMQAAKVEGDQVAVIGERKKLLIFALSEMPEMNRGKGVKLQSYHDRGLADVK
ncbi:MAG: DNA gyrase subunit A, partial [Terricaulis sp.]